MSSPCSEESVNVKCEIKIEGGGKIKTGKQSDPPINSPVTMPFYPLSYIYSNYDYYSYYQMLAAAAATQGIFFQNQ